MYLVCSGLCHLSSHPHKYLLYVVLFFFCGLSNCKEGLGFVVVVVMGMGLPIHS